MSAKRQCFEGHLSRKPFGQICIAERLFTGAYDRCPPDPFLPSDGGGGRVADPGSPAERREAVWNGRLLSGALPRRQSLVACGAWWAVLISSHWLRLAPGHRRLIGVSSIIAEDKTPHGAPVIN